MQSNKKEWLEITKNSIDYHERQFKTPYRSTIAFCNWLENLEVITPNSALEIVDIGSGKGANIFYMAKTYKKSNFLGIDLNSELVEGGIIFIMRKIFVIAN